MSTENMTYTKAESWKIFDTIYRRYDLLNTLLSLGLHKSWRAKLVNFVPSSKQDLKLLDLATGTADVAITITERIPRITQTVGIDLSENMLQLGRNKVNKHKLSSKISLQKGDAAKLSFLTNEFDMATMAFGIRNIENPILALKEIFRVLNTGGKAVILEFSLPANFFIRSFYLIYLKFFVPLIGGLISNNFKAYFYLNQTIEKFPYGEIFCRMLRQCGFKNVNTTPLLMGIATIYCGEKIS